MDLKTYLANKEKRNAEIKAEEDMHRDWCFRCFRVKKNCLCSEIRSFDPNIKFVLLMHPMEARKERVGTGRLAHLTLINSEIIEGIDFTNNKRVNDLILDKRYLSYVLYPGESAYNISNPDATMPDFKDKIPLIFVIDGTWPCAKKMMKLSYNIQQLPRICFTPTVRSRFDVKFQPNEMCLSTIESIHFFLNEWQRVGNDNYNQAHNRLIDVFDKMVELQKKCALDPSLPSYRKGRYKEYCEKKYSKKWESRKLFFD